MANPDFCSRKLQTRDDDDINNHDKNNTDRQIILKCEMILTTTTTPSFNKQQHQTDQEAAGDQHKQPSSTTDIINALQALPEMKTSAVADTGYDDPMTPTPSDQKITEIGLCPPAPRKPKSSPISERKHYRDCHITHRNGNSMGRLLDLSKEVESMFPTLKLGLKMKKAPRV